MNEHFLHYLWKFQKFNTNDIVLSNGESLKVFHQGHHNHHSGPDFEEARIKIDEIEWAGQIEIHVKSSDWHKHRHGDDPAYGNVILHVVWNHDQDIWINGVRVPTLKLKNIVDGGLLNRMESYFSNKDQILCSNQLKQVSDLTFNAMIDRAIIERLETKASVIIDNLSRLNNDWEAVTYLALASNFGFSTNKPCFVKLTDRLPYQILRKNFENSISTEALVFGQSGFLEEKNDGYQTILGQEYDFLRSKYKLPDPLSRTEWKFSKMRPANFPTVRLAQFASLLHQHPSMFSKLIMIENPSDIIRMLSFQASGYWQKHYDFGKKKSRLSKSIGKTTMENLLINSVVPLLAAYSKYIDNQGFMDRAISLLELIPAESNRITKSWIKWKIPKSAFESQGLIQLTNEYCNRRRCLNCNIGISLLHK